MVSSGFYCQFLGIRGEPTAGWRRLRYACKPDVGSPRACFDGGVLDSTHKLFDTEFVEHSAFARSEPFGRRCRGYPLARKDFGQSRDGTSAPAGPAVIGRRGAFLRARLSPDSRCAGAE